MTIGVESSSAEYNFTVDGQNLSATIAAVQDEAVLYHNNIYNSSGLADDTEHTLFLNVTSVGKNSIEFSRII